MKNEHNYFADFADAFAGELSGNPYEMYPLTNMVSSNTQLALGL